MPALIQNAIDWLIRTNPWPKPRAQTRLEPMAQQPSFETIFSHRSRAFEPIERSMVENQRPRKIEARLLIPPMNHLD